MIRKSEYRFPEEGHVPTQESEAMARLASPFSSYAVPRLTRKLGISRAQPNCFAVICYRAIEVGFHSPHMTTAAVGLGKVLIEADRFVVVMANAQSRSTGNTVRTSRDEVRIRRRHRECGYRLAVCGRAACRRPDRD